MTTRRQFLAGAAALVVAPSVLTFASCPTVVATFDGVPFRGPVSGHLWYTPTADEMAADVLARIDNIKTIAGGKYEPDPGPRGFWID